MSATSVPIKSKEAKEAAGYRLLLSFFENFVFIFVRTVPKGSEARGRF